MSLISPKTALVSLSDKSNLDQLIEFLLNKEVKIISSGGTFNAIKKITDKVLEVSEDEINIHKEFLKKELKKNFY